MEGWLNGMIREYIIKISDEIMEEEIADRPQELVRCKDCRHYTGKDCNYNDIFPAPREDWYCADGERRQKNE